MKNGKYQYLSIPTDEEVGNTTSPLLRQQQVVPEWKCVAISLGIIACAMVLAAVILGIYAIKHDNDGEDYHH